MVSIHEKRERYVGELNQALEKVLEQLKNDPDVLRVVVFGSYATGRRDLLIDLDLIVVMNSKLDFTTRTAQLYTSLQPGIDMDLLVYTPEEFETMKERAFLHKALGDGKVVYEKAAS